MFPVCLYLPTLMRRLSSSVESVGSAFVSVDGARESLLFEELFFEYAGIVECLSALSGREASERGCRLRERGSALSELDWSTGDSPLVSAILNLVRSSCSLKDSIPSLAMGREPKVGGTCLIIPRP